MKYLLLLPLVLFALWLIQRGRHRINGKDSKDQTQQPPEPKANPLPTEIIECAHCAVHLPRTEAVAGRHGLHYCGEAHRQDAEGG